MAEVKLRYRQLHRSPDGTRTDVVCSLGRRWYVLRTEERLDGTHSASVMEIQGFHTVERWGPNGSHSSVDEALDAAADWVEGEKESE